jgi:hypothetical protein
MKIQNKLSKNNRVFLIPLDHPKGEDTKRLNSIGVQNFVKQIDHLGQDGYIFHSRSYLDQPIVTHKEFFLTVGEEPDNYLCDIGIFEKIKKIHYLTIFFEVRSETDNTAHEFYRDYVEDLKKRGYFVMGMGFPPDNIINCSYYQHIADIARRLDCDAFKTDYFAGLEHLNLGKMKLFIGGGKYISDNTKFRNFANQVADLKIASCSFGRNIFESDDPAKRINLVIGKLKR